MSRCEEIRPLIYAFLDEELGEEQAARVGGHLDACPGCRRVADAERRFLARVAEAGRETAPSSLRSRVEEILGTEARGPVGETADEAADEAMVRPIRSSRWRRALVPVAAAAALALMLLRPWGDVPSTARAASFAVDYAAHAVAAPSTPPFPEGAEPPEPPPLSGARLVGFSQCIVDGATYAHFTYAVADGHLSVFLPLADAPLPGAGTAREGPTAVLTLEPDGAAPGAILVSADLDADELRSIWARSLARPNGTR